MDGEKMEQAKNAVISSSATWTPRGGIAIIRYERQHRRAAPRRVGDIRERLIGKVREIQASGGNIPRAPEGPRPARRSPARAVSAASSSSATASTPPVPRPRLAKTSAQHGVTISSMGIGLDFDESYMGYVARAGRGNFAFVKDAAALAGFPPARAQGGRHHHRRVRHRQLTLPAGVRAVSAIGADLRLTETRSSSRWALSSPATSAASSSEFTGDLPASELRTIRSSVAWTRASAPAVTASRSLQIGGALATAEVEESRDTAVLASATSALASVRQLAATEAYNRGDGALADALIAENEAELQARRRRRPQGPCPHSPARKLPRRQALLRRRRPHQHRRQGRRQGRRRRRRRQHGPERLLTPPSARPVPTPHSSSKQGARPDERIRSSSWPPQPSPPPPSSPPGALSQAR
ncbi:MAG: hypothetical protein R3B70_30355 [Polyangiaceae bacterium]